MSYAAIEAAAQILLQALDRFDNADVTRGDWRVLDRGDAPYAVLYPGPFETGEDGDWGQHVVDWTMYCEVFERYLDNGTSEVSLEATRQDVVDTFFSHPTLNGVSGVTRVLPERGEPPQYVYDESGGGPHFVMQRIEVHVIERVCADGAGEFA